MKAVKEKMKDIFNMFNAKGFTLLELLVVVVIIGILAAIALPQYQLSVDKSKFAAYKIMAKSLTDAYWRYLLTHSISPSDIDDLDIELPKGYTKTSPAYQSCAVFDDMFCCVNYPKAGHHAGAVICGDKNNTVAIYQYLLDASNANIPENSIYNVCAAKSNNKRAIRLCESMPHGGIMNNAYLPTQSGVLGGYTFYLLKN